jgi:GTP cyclohydrolase II
VQEEIPMTRPDVPQPQRHHLQISHHGQVESFVFEFPARAPVIAIVIGSPHSQDAPLIRLHSRCLYGEAFGSLDCDCQAQLELASQVLKEEGAGILIYLEQEGRGCGLLNKVKAYVLKDSRYLDTVEAYRHLNLPIDARFYTDATDVLKYFGLTRVRLLTNNPAKVSALVEAGIAVEQLYLRTKPTDHNIDYLRVKQAKLGHDLGL